MRREALLGEVTVPVQRRGQDVWLPLLTPEGKEAGGRIQASSSPPTLRAARVRRAACWRRGGPRACVGRRWVVGAAVGRCPDDILGMRGPPPSLPY